MGNESELGKGLFGYRKSAVEQIMTDRDQMLRQAEGRVRAAESKVAELSTELNAMQDRNTRMDEQIERLRAQLDEVARSQASPNAAPVWTEPQAADVVVPPLVDVPVPTTAAPAAPVATAPESVSDLPVDPAAVAAPEVAPTQSAWDEPAAWSEAEPASAYQEYDPQPEPASQMPEVAYAPEDRYGYGEAAAMPEPAAEAQATESAYDGWASDSTYDPATATYEAEPAAYEPPAPASEPEPTYEPQAFQPEPAIEPEAFQPEPAPAADDVTPGYDPSPVEAPRAEAPEPPAVQPEPKDESPKVDDLTQRFLNDELAQILRAAEESAARIVERARTTTEQQIDESNRLWHEVQAEVARFAAWRDEVEPVIHAVQSKVDGVRTYIDEVPERIREALAPVAESISAIDTDLAELASRATPPLLLTPGGVVGSTVAETFEPEPESEPVPTEESFGWIPGDADPTEAAVEDEPAHEDLDDQEYDVPFGEGWTEVGDQPFEGGPDHTFGANAG
jgi:hypothetical protein